MTSTMPAPPPPLQAIGSFPLNRPALQRRQSSTLSIEHGDFEWLKQYFKPEPDEPVVAAALPVPTAAAAPTAAPSRKHRHSDDAPIGDFPALSPLKHEGHEDDEMDDGGHKRRRKIGWTNTEDLTILAAVRRVGTQWQRIADNLPGRTADAVRNRWHRLQRTHALSDTDEGRSALDGLLVASGIDVDWCPPDLANDPVAPTGSGTAEPCIRGSDHGRQMWSPEEDQIIRDGVARFGCKWRQIASLLNGRTDSSVRNRWMRLCRENQSVREDSYRASQRDSLGEALSPLASTTALVGQQNEENAYETGAVVEATIVQSGLVRQSSQEMVIDVDELSASLKSSLEVDKLPLGLDAPTMVLDLDSFADAVSRCVEADASPAEMPHYEAFDAPLMAKAPPRSQPASSASIEVAGDDEYSAPLSMKLVSAALAGLAVVTVASTVMRRR